MYSGGLLVNTIAIFASISSDVVAKEDLHKFRNQINQIYWDCCCSYEECYLREDASDYNEYKEQHWILEPKYKNSRTKVIGQAIADCVTGENEFAGKKPNDIITFKDTDPVTYNQKHWNAVILYNYIHEAINGEGLPARGRDYKNLVYDVSILLKDKLDELKQNYGDEYNEAIDKAVEYIQDYVRALKLEVPLYEFRASKLKYDNENIQYIAPCVSDSSDNNKLIFNKAFYQFDERSQKQRWLYCPTFRYYDGKLYIAKLKVEIEDWDEDHVVDDEPITYLDIEQCQEKAKWLRERLGSLLYSPTKNIIEKWAKEDKKAEEQARLKKKQEGRK